MYVAASSSTSGIASGPTMDSPDELTDLSSFRLDAIPTARGSSDRLEPRIPGTRRSSKSVSGARPPLSTSANSHRVFQPDAGPSSSGSGSGSGTQSPSTGQRTRHGLKRRISTPNLAKRTLPEEEEKKVEAEAQPLVPPSLTAPVKAFETRARSTSTSIVVPQTLPLDQESPTVAVQTLPQIVTTNISVSSPPPWTSMYVTPPSPPPTAPDTPPSGILSQAYDIGEAVVSRVMSWAQPIGSHRRERRSSRRSSDDDSEKGLDGSEEEEPFDDEEDGPRVGVGRNAGRYWGLFGDGTGDDSYFSMPPTPPDEDTSMSELTASLPTPALSTQSLSRDGSRRGRRSRRNLSTQLQGGPADGWWVRVYRTYVSGGGSSTGKTAEVIRELGWTVAFLAGLFVVSFLLVVYAVQSMPITQLKSMPTSTTDLQLLSHEIRHYMSSGSAGWWHTVAALCYIGCWKHAWSVPGAVVLNILVGSVFDPIPALGLLTLITASGSLGAYCLSRPLAPLIAVLFPKPLALVRAALAPDAIPRETVTPVQVSSNPSDRPIGAPEDRPNVWRRLLLMRAMGFVPWSGMNVACGVVGVDWRTFWLTTAAGSASWSYVTASVGNILSRLALPASTAEAGVPPGESLTSLLRDPTLIAKLAFLTLITLVPVMLKRRNNNTRDDSDDSSPPTPSMASNPSALGLDMSSLGHNRRGSDGYAAPPSPLATSLANFTPTPRVFDLFSNLLSFGRTAVRQGTRATMVSARSASNTIQRLVANVRS